MNTLIEILRRIDGFNMGKVTTLSHFIQRMTGKNCFRQNSFLILISACIATTFLSQSLIERNWFLSFACIMILIIYIPAMVLWNKKTEADTKPGMVNINILDYKKRIGTILITSLLTHLHIVTGLYSLSDNLLILYFVVQMSSNHLVAVTPLPPCNGKFKEFLTKLTSSRGTKFAGAQA